jgi:hypothetical protein
MHASSALKLPKTPTRLPEDPHNLGEWTVMARSKAAIKVLRLLKSTDFSLDDLWEMRDAFLKRLKVVKAAKKRSAAAKKKRR